MQLSFARMGWFLWREIDGLSVLCLEYTVPEGGHTSRRGRFQWQLESRKRP